MSRSLGVLTLDLIAKIGGFVSGMTEAERAADKSAKRIEASIKSIGVTSYAVGSALGQYLKQGIDTLASAFPALIDQAAQFQDIAEKTGGSAEGFASLAVSAKVGGASMEELTSASIKLTKNLTGVDDESKAAGAALKALGIPIADFKKLAPDEQFVRISEALGGFADGAGKTAVATDLLGKSGAQLLPFLKELYNAGGRQKILTDDQIKQADDYADRQAKLRAELGLYASAIATQAIPSLNALGNAAKDLLKDFLDANKGQDDLARNLAILDWAEKAALALGTVAEAAVFVGRTIRAVGGSVESVYADSKLISALTPTGLAAAALRGDTLTSLYNERDTKAKEANQRYVDLWNADGTKITTAIKKSFDDQRKVLKNNADPEIQRLLARSRAGQGAAPTLAYSGAAEKPKKGASDDPTKKLLDNDLKAFQAQADQAKELLGDRNKILDLYNAQGLISVKDYYAAQTANLSEATAAQQKALDDQIKALEAFKAKAPKDTDRADAQGKINELLMKQAKLQRESGMSAVEMGFKQEQAAKAYQASLNELNAKILELNGSLGAAASIRFDAQNEQLKNLATASGDFASVAQIDRLREYTVAQADLNAVQAKFSLAQGDLQIAEDRLTMARERGSMGEIEGLRASGDARRAAIVVMDEQLKKLLALDAVLRTPEQNQAIERLKLQLEGLKATVDPLADKFNTMLGDGFGNAFGDFLTGAKSAKEALADFATDVTNQITRLVAQELGKKLFKSLLGGSDTGGAGGFLSSLLGGGSGASLAGLFGGGGGSAGGDVLGAFIGAKGFSAGGFTGMGAANDAAGIVHRNEYVLDANTTRRIGVGNLDRVKAGGALGGGMVVNFAVQGKLDRSTQTQAANRLRRETATAGARY
jgi:hypothetical protein